MKDIETMLSQHPPKPKRPLKAHFTQGVTMGIHQRRSARLWYKLRCALPNGLFTKIGAATLGGIVLISGSVAAITMWPKPVVTPTIEKQVPSGNRIVGYDAQNCNYFSGIDGSAPNGSTEKLYYEVRQGSKLTNQQLQDSLQAICEENISGNAVSAVMKKLPKNLPNITSSPSFIITDISAHSISIRLDPHYNSATYTFRYNAANENIKPSLTYTNFADHMLTYNLRNQISFSELKVGDTVKIIVQDTSNTPPETRLDRNVFNYPEAIVVHALIKVPPLSADPGVFYLAVGGDLVRVEACKSSPTGFCRVYEFAQ